MKSVRLICLFLLSMSFSVAAALPDPVRLVIAPDQRTWSLQERVGSAYRTVLKGARVHAVRADGTVIEWTSIVRAPDGHSVKVQAPGIAIKIVAQWAPSSLLPGTVTLLPIVFSSEPDLALRELRLVDGAELPTIGAAPLVFENGFQSWSRTEVRALPADGSLTSWWNTVIHGSRATCVAGYLSSVLGSNALTVSRNETSVVLSARSDLRRLSIPKTAAGTPLDALYLSWGRNPTDMLAQYAAAARVFTDIMDPPPAFRPQPVPAGWCSWYYFYGGVREGDVVANTEAARTRFGTRDFRLIQIDDGFQVAAGDWDTNDKFPRGHRWLTDFIHSRGYQAGLWLAPFVIGQSSSLYRDHPEWLLRDAQGEPVRLWNSPGWGGDLYVLDPSIQGVRQWLKDLFQKVTSEWGYDYVKIDFLYTAMDEKGVMSGDMTPVQAYRAALKAIRAGAGPDTYILGCGAPIGPSIGLMNGNRVGFDVGASWKDLQAGLMNTPNRQWMHNVWWQNDPDTLLVRSPLTEDQAQSWATIVGLSGGLNLIGDNLPELTDKQVALARRTYPIGANGNVTTFGPKPRASARATGSRVADMWTPRPPVLPALFTESGQTLVNLEGWRIRPGDDPQWAGADIDDRDWTPMVPGLKWEVIPGMEQLDGFAWMRARFRVPEGAAQQPLTLFLGRIDDSDEAFVNGKKVGATGKMPPDYETGVNEWRRYPVPADAIRWDPREDNVVAVRVYDGVSDGGMTEMGPGRPPSLYMLASSASPINSTVLAFLNQDNEPKSVRLDPAAWGIVKRGKQAHVWDVWQNRYLGAIVNPITLDQNANGVRLLAVTPDLGRPQVIASDAHVTAGAADIRGVKWVPEGKALKGQSRVVPNQPYRLAVALPAGWKLIGAEAPNATVSREPAEPGCLVLRFTPKVSEMTWTLRFAGP